MADFLKLAPQGHEAAREDNPEAPTSFGISFLPMMRKVARILATFSAAGRQQLELKVKETKP